uniref:Thioredoxin domain-containing protein n=1 Tax=Strongyloides venezuelensis TaxID=75913 RepID=A0A0K0FAZ2_STRVS
MYKILTYQLRGRRNLKKLTNTFSMTRMNIFNKLLFLFFIITLTLASTKKDEKKKELDKVEKKKDLSHGFPKEIDWIEWDKATKVAKDLNKPIFLMIHKTWCNACKLLKKSFFDDPEQEKIVEASKDFVMVNLEDDEEPQDEMYGPDGMYIPRILFLSIDGKPLSVNNKKDYPHNHYYYPRINSVLKGMKRALKVFNGDEESKKLKKEDKKDLQKEKEKKNTIEEKVKSSKKNESEKKNDGDKKKDSEKKKDGDKKKDSEKEKDSDKKNDSKKTKEFDKKKETERKKSTKKPKKEDDIEGCPHAEKAKAVKKAAEEAKKQKKKDNKKKDEKKSDKSEKKEKDTRKDKKSVGEGKTKNNGKRNKKNAKTEL